MKKINGRPPNIERNNAIIADTKAGMLAENIAKKHGLVKQYVQKIFSEYLRKQKIGIDDNGSIRLFAERDMEMKKFYKSLNKKGALSMINIETKAASNTKGRYNV